MGNTLFIVWRESVEGILVVGILYAWLKAHPEGARGMRYLWGGVAAGLALAGLLALAMMGVYSSLDGDALDYFQLGMMLVAAGLITQMVFWMRRHGRALKKQLEADLDRATGEANWMGVSVIAMLAVGRESAETVIFLYGNGMGQQGMALAQFLGAAALGFALALLTFWLLVRGGRNLSWKNFFRISETLLLLLAAGLLVGGVEKMIGYDWIPALVDPVWDSSFLLDDNATVGNLVATLTGYRSHPALMLVLAYTAYWALVLGWPKISKSTADERR
ncbi:MAG: FTR1 family protein [Betaproteobacteria bacterium]|nr:FTR1 family protein [Betaproteobacteria bacterium]